MAGEGASAGLRRGTRADRERRPARLRHLLGDRALLLPEVLGVARSDRALHRSGAAHEADQLPDARPRAPVPQPDGAGLADRECRHPHRRPLRVRRRPRPRLDPLARRDRLREMVERYDESLEILFKALESGGEPFSNARASSSSPRRADRPAADAEVPRVHRRHERQDVRPRRHEGLGRRRPAASALRGTTGPADLYRAPAPSTATSPTSSGSMRATSTRTATPRSARPRQASRASSPAMRHRSWSTRSRPPTTSTPRGTASTPPASSRGSPRPPTTR